MWLTRRRSRFLTALLLASLCSALSFGQAQDHAVVPQSPHGWLDPTVNEEYKKWLGEEVVYIITDQERADFKKLIGDKQRDEFVIAFWEHRNPTPGDPENKFKEEHYQRLAFANQHFASGVAGWKTDRGHIYIVYGPPDEIEQHPGSAGKYPHEVWRYRNMKAVGRGVSVRFVDSCRCGEYRLTGDWTEKATPVDKD